jgi:hypothetical protein
MAQSVRALRNILYFVHVERHWYLQHDMGRTMPAVGRIKVTGQAGSLAVRANVDVYHRTINTVEASAYNVLLTIETLDARVLERWFVLVVV